MTLHVPTKKRRSTNGALFKIASTLKTPCRGTPGEYEVLDIVRSALDLKRSYDVLKGDLPTTARRCDPATVTNKVDEGRVVADRARNDVVARFLDPTPSSGIERYEVFLEESFDVWYVVLGVVHDEAPFNVAAYSLSRFFDKNTPPSNLKVKYFTTAFVAERVAAAKLDDNLATFWSAVETPPAPVFVRLDGKAARKCNVLKYLPARVRNVVVEDDTTKETFLVASSAITFPRLAPPMPARAASAPEPTPAPRFQATPLFAVTMPELQSPAPTAQSAISALLMPAISEAFAKQPPRYAFDCNEPAPYCATAPVVCAHEVPTSGTMFWPTVDDVSSASQEV